LLITERLGAEGAIFVGATGRSPLPDASQTTIFLFTFPSQQVILSDCDLLSPEIHHEGLTSQQLGSYEDVMSFGRNAVDRTPLAVKDSLSEIDFLFHQSSCGNLKPFSPDSEPFAPNQ
jgi:hypothetical protein